MALITCPECGHEVSTTADACPNCGHTFIKPAVQRNVVVSEVPREREGFPPWAFVPLGILAVVLVFLLFYFMRNNDETANSNISVNVSARRPVNDTKETTIHTDSQPSEVIVPPSSEPQQVIVPPPAPPSDTTITRIPPETVAPDKGTVSIEAKVATNSGTTQPVNAEKFYLLDDDLQSILNDADLKDETGKGLTTAFALSVVFPDRYGDTRKKALDEINKHIKYDVTTDASGKAQMKDVKPGSYYFFGIHKTRNGYALWSQPVSIQPGDNKLVLSPVRMTEISQ